MILRILSVCRYAKSKSLPVPPQIAYKTDIYNSVHLTVKDKLPQSEFNAYMDKVMHAQLQHNKKANQLNQHKQQEKQTNAVWVHLQSDNIGLASYLCQNGFSIHHGLGNKLSLCRWIANKKDLITPYSTFHISAGAMLIHDDKVLLVQEKNGSRKDDFGIPGGRADPGETIPSCAQRQLYQQTNIKAKYSYLLHFRQLENTAYGGMDIYFACVMNFEPNAFDNIKICQRQLSAYKWVHLSEYEQFCLKNSVGTQYQLAKYVTKLYKSGYDFKKRIANETTYEKYASPRDKVIRQVIQHGLVQGTKIDKIYD